MERSWKKAAAETVLAAVLCTAFCLLAVALFAVFVRAYAPSDITVTVVNQAIRCVGAFVFSLVCIRGDRAFFKGIAAGVLSVLFTSLAFGAIGGFHFTALFPVWLVLSGIFGALGALCGKKLRKE